MPDAQGWDFETLQVHAAQRAAPENGAASLPIFQTAAYEYESIDQAAARFALETPGYMYSRSNNPTVAAVAERIATLEGGIGAVLTASGQAATALSILAIAEAGDHIVASASLYGGTRTLFTHTLSRLGIAFTFIEDPHRIDDWRTAVRPETKALFAETIPNPRNDILDFEAVADVAHAAGVPFIIDNTVATPYLFRPFEHGADISVHSATKYLGGHGTTLGGAIVDGGTFDWTARPERFPRLTAPEPAQHGLVYSERFGAHAYLARVRTRLLGDIGATLSPFNAFLIHLGIETLSLRMERHVQNALAVAQWLETHPLVESVSYAGLPSSPYFERAQRYLPRGAGAVLGFEIRGGLDAGRTFVGALPLFRHVSNIGDVRSLVVHPATTTHSRLTAQQQRESGVSPGFIRLSIGIESLKDIVSSLEIAFAAVAAEG